MKNARIAVALVAALVAAAALPGSARGIGLDPRITFDNPYALRGREGSRHLEIEVDAPEHFPFDDGPPPPVNLVLVIDRSGSMAASGKIDYVRETALDILSRLGPEDTFSLVSFSDYAQVLIPAGRAWETGPATDIVRRLQPGGSTNLHDGLVRGYREARRFQSRGGVNRVLLLTDGLANRGVTDPSLLARMVSAEAESGVVLSTFGVGLDYNEDLLANLSDAGRGSYYYVAHPSQIPGMLAREFGEASRAVFLDVTITIELHRGCRLDRVLGFPFTRDGDRVVIHLGDIPAGARRRVISEIFHPAGSGSRLEVGDVSVNYRERGREKSLEHRSRLFLELSGDRDEVSSSADVEAQKRAALAAAGEEMSRAAELADRGDFRGARKALDKADKVLEESPVKDEETKERKQMIRGYVGAVEAAPSMAPAELESVQKETKFKLYEMQRSRQN